MQKINHVINSLLSENTWRTKSPRGFKTVYRKNVQFEINPLYPILSNEFRKFNWKYFTGELAWFLSTNEDISFISNFSKFWNNITDENNKVNSNYGTRLLSPHNSTQLSIAYKALIKDIDSRQAIAFISGKEFQKETKDFPCTIYINFSINDNKLDMVVRMRSNDIVFGLSYDAPWFSIIHQNMYLLLKGTYNDLDLGTYTHSADDFHWYVDRHTKEIASFQDSSIQEDYLFRLKKPLFDFCGDETILTECGDYFISDCQYDKKYGENFYKALLSEFIEIKRQ